MTQLLSFPHQTLPDSAERLRNDIRNFLERERLEGSFVPRSDGWLACDPAFSRKLGAASNSSVTT